MGGAKEPTVVAGIEFDALIDRSEEHNASVPQYPIDAGYSVTDNVSLEPMKLKMTLYVTATPVTWLDRHGVGEQRVENICSQLLGLYESRSLISVTTPFKSYSNMVIKNISIRDTVQSGYAREIPIELTQITITSAKTVAVPAEYARAGSTMESAGAASTSQSSSSMSLTSTSGQQSGSSGSSGTSGAGSGGSILYKMADGVGNYTGWYSLD